MKSGVFLNGRFLCQPLSGVQRFSSEITAAIDDLVAQGEWPDTTVLMPSPGRSATNMEASGLFPRLRFEWVGRTRGHLWEQTELPAAARGGILVSLGNTAPLLAGSRQVVVIHDAGVFDTPESYSPRFRAWYKTLQRGLVKLDVKVVTVSAFSRERIAARLGIERSRIAVISEGADHILRQPADPATLTRHELRRGRYALIVGNRVAHKNLAALQEAALALHKRGIAVAVAGAIPAAWAARAKSKRGIAVAVAGASDCSVFDEIPGMGFMGRPLGRVTDGELRALYESAFCLLFPSRYEGFGLPPVEAMACGCPVLASASGAVEEVCGDAALYFSADDGRSIRDTVERLLGDEGLAERLRARGRDRVAALSWNAAARALGDVVRGLS